MKKLLIPILLFTCIACSNEKINTIIERENGIYMSMNYPITNIKKLDQKIKKDIDIIYDDFKAKNVKNSELNIDYDYYKNGNYISIVLKISESNNQNKETITTYFFDINKNKFLNLNDVIDGYSDNLFSFDNKYLYTYLNNDNNYIVNKYLLSNLKLKINWKKIEIEKVVASQPNRRVLNPDDKFVALTFDDGPSPYTKELIDTLKKNNATATFFILGNKVKAYKTVLKESIQNGNELGNHSYNHKWLIKLDSEHMLTQINDTQKIIQECLGYTPVLFRPTYGSVNNNMKKITNLDIVLWTVDTLDWKYKSVDKIVKMATKNIKDGDIILMHEIHKRSIEAVKQIIPILKKQGFTFVTISELREIQKIRSYEKNSS